MPDSTSEFTDVTLVTEDSTSKYTDVTLSPEDSTNKFTDVTLAPEDSNRRFSLSMKGRALYVSQPESNATSI